MAVPNYKNAEINMPSLFDSDLDDFVDVDYDESKKSDVEKISDKKSVKFKESLFRPDNNIHIIHKWDNIFKFLRETQEHRILNLSDTYGNLEWNKFFSLKARFYLIAEISENFSNDDRESNDLVYHCRHIMYSVKDLDLRNKEKEIAWITIRTLPNRKESVVIITTSAKIFFRVLLKTAWREADDSDKTLLNYYNYGENQSDYEYSWFWRHMEVNSIFFKRWMDMSMSRLERRMMIGFPALEWFKPSGEDWITDPTFTNPGINTEAILDVIHNWEKSFSSAEYFFDYRKLDGSDVYPGFNWDEFFDRETEVIQFQGIGSGPPHGEDDLSSYSYAFYSIKLSSSFRKYALWILIRTLPNEDTTYTAAFSTLYYMLRAFYTGVWSNERGMRIFVKCSNDTEENRVEFQTYMNSHRRLFIDNIHHLTLVINNQLTDKIADELADIVLDRLDDISLGYQMDHN